MSSFSPTFSDYQAVVLDYEGFEFAPPVKQAFVDYVRNGGGLVVLHAADNAFPAWAESNEMIGVGGWGGFTPGYGNRTQAAGPKIRWRDGGLVLDNDTPGTAQHPSPHDFLMTVRAPEHPIMKGLPSAWMHAKDELYSNLRGPAKNVTFSRPRRRRRRCRTAPARTSRSSWRSRTAKGASFTTRLATSGRRRRNRSSR